MAVRNSLARLGVPLVLAVSAGGLTACGMMQEAKTEQAAAEAAPLTDGEIVAVLHALNQGEIRHAELAMQKSRDPEVLDTAQMILTDHENMERRTMTLAGVADIQPQENALSRSLTKQAQQMEKQLAGLSGSEFDQAYLEAQAMLHKLAIETVQQDLLPSASNPQLKQMLTQATTGLKRHLQQAEASQESTPRS